MTTYSIRDTQGRYLRATMREAVNREEAISIIREAARHLGDPADGEAEVHEDMIQVDGTTVYARLMAPDETEAQS